MRAGSGDRDEPPPLPVGEPVPGGAAGRPARAPLAGRYVRLEPLDPAAHGDALWRAAYDGSDEARRMWTYLSYGPFADPPEMRAWLDTVAPSEDPMFFAVIDPDGPLGMASFLNVDAEMRRLEIGHLWYAPRAQRTEANTEAAYLMMREAFDRLGYRRVEWKTDALNERSRDAALRLGFTFEGVFRHHMVVKGRNRDSAWYSVIAPEWPAVREALERWLAAPAADRPSHASLRAGPDR
jgi:RimJ/RimL family protein N-acetyltransferase